MLKSIAFTRHAEFKLALLRKHGFRVTRVNVEAALRKPIRVLSGYSGRKIAESHLTEDHLLRVVFEESSEGSKVITLYPVRKERYESHI